ncbi:hypothetical protein V6N13_054558 [Hibiscus sabdariffa]
MVWSDVRDNICWIIVSGKDIDFWRDTWIRDLGPLIAFVLSENADNLGSVSVAEMSDGSGNWRWSLFSHLLPENVLLHIAAVKGPLTSSSRDRVGWRGSSDLAFSIKSAYVLRTRQQNSVPPNSVLALLHEDYLGIPIGVST